MQVSSYYFKSFFLSMAIFSSMFCPPKKKQKIDHPGKFVWVIGYEGVGKKVIASALMDELGAIHPSVDRLKVSGTGVAIENARGKVFDLTLDDACDYYVSPDFSFGAVFDDPKSPARICKGFLAGTLGRSFWKGAYLFAIDQCKAGKNIVFTDVPDDPEVLQYALSHLKDLDSSNIRLVWVSSQEVSSAIEESDLESCSQGSADCRPKGLSVSQRSHEYLNPVNHGNGLRYDYKINDIWLDNPKEDAKNILDLFSQPSRGFENSSLPDKPHWVEEFQDYE